METSAVPVVKRCWGLRLGLWALVLGALAVAVLVGYSGLVRGREVVTMTLTALNGSIWYDHNEGSPLPKLPPLPGDTTASDRYRRAQQVAGLWTDGTGHLVLDRYQALAAAHPDDPVILGYRTLQAYEGRESWAKWEPIIRNAMAHDPGNALYHYQLAESLLQDGYQLQSTKRTDPNGIDGTLYTVKDRAKLEAGMAELRAGLAAPALRRYHGAMMRRRLAALPPPRRAEDFLYAEMVNSLEELPELSRVRSMTRYALACGQLLIREGRPQEALPYLDAWRRIPRQMLTEVDLEIVLYVVAGMSRRMGPTAATLYTRAGHPELASAATATVAALTARPRRPLGWGGIGPQSEKFGGMLAMSAEGLLGTGYATPADLAPVRMLEYTLIEEVTLALLLVALTVLLLGHLWAAGGWMLQLRKARTKTCTTLPRLRWWLPWAVACVALPVGAYLWYTRFSGWAGRDVSAVWNWRHLLLDLGIVGVLCIVIPLVPAFLSARRRCRALGYALPPVWQEVLHRLAVGWYAIPWGLGWLWLWLLTSPSISDEFTSGFFSGFEIPGIDHPSAIPTWSIFLALVLLPLGQMVLHWFRGPQPYAAYYGSMARALAPVFAVLILLYTLLMPALRRAELDYIRQDRVIFAAPGQLHSPAWTRLIADEQAVLLKALK